MKNGLQAAREEFLEFLRAHRVELVCCAHGLAFDTHMHNGTRFVMSGGGGSGLCSPFRGICTEGQGHPEDRGRLYHMVEITISEAGEISGRVLQAFGPAGSPARFGFAGAS